MKVTVRIVSLVVMLCWTRAALADLWLYQVNGKKWVQADITKPVHLKVALTGVAFDWGIKSSEKSFVKISVSVRGKATSTITKYGEVRSGKLVVTGLNIAPGPQPKEVLISVTCDGRYDPGENDARVVVSR